MTVKRQPGELVAHGQRFQKQVTERAALRGPQEEYLYDERRFMRYTCPWGALLALSAIPVTAAHGVAAGIAGAAGIVLAAAFLGIALTWRQPWSWPAFIVLAVASAWPAASWVAWLFIWGLGMLFFIVVAVALWSARRAARRSIAAHGAVYADWTRSR